MFFETLLFFFGINIWSPGLQSVNVSPQFTDIAPIEKKWVFNPVVNAKAVLVMDAKSSTVLYHKNGYQSLPMASLTKLTTALIIAENHPLNDIISISKGSQYTQGSTMKLEQYEKISVRNVLYGLLMNSGNDAAIALARHHSKGTVYDFVEAMNNRARELRLTKTRYSNPHGFDSDSHYSSAYDIAKVAKKLLTNPQIRKIVSTRSIVVTSEDGGIEHQLSNTNQLLGTIYPIYGIKTGTTPKAGQCLALLVKKNGREYIIVILGSEDRYLDAKILLWKIML